MAGRLGNVGALGAVLKKTKAPAARKTLMVSREIADRAKDGAWWDRVSLQTFVEAAILEQIGRMEVAETERTGQPFTLPTRPRK